ncbi:hypothetical protein ACHQM5_001488 [Ranunculus cassubicifolius]
MFNKHNLPIQRCQKSRNSNSTKMIEPTRNTTIWKFPHIRSKQHDILPEVNSLQGNGRLHFSTSGNKHTRILSGAHGKRVSSPPLLFISINILCCYLHFHHLFPIIPLLIRLEHHKSDFMSDHCSSLKGTPIMQISSEVAAVGPSPPLEAYDIRHVSKDENSCAASQDLHKVRTRSRFKRSGTSGSKAGKRGESEERTTSHESSVIHQTELNAEGGGCSHETESMFSVETVEASLVSRCGAELEPVPKFGKFEDGESDVELELTLGFEPTRREKSWSPIKEKSVINGEYPDTCKMEVGVDYPPV